MDRSRKQLSRHWEIELKWHSEFISPCVHYCETLTGSQGHQKHPRGETRQNWNSGQKSRADFDTPIPRTSSVKSGFDGIIVDHFVSPPRLFFAMLLATTKRRVESS